MSIQMQKDSAEYFHSPSSPWELRGVVFLRDLLKDTSAAPFCLSLQWGQGGVGVPMSEGVKQ